MAFDRSAIELPNRCGTSASDDRGRHDNLAEVVASVIADQQKMARLHTVLRRTAHRQVAPVVGSVGWGWCGGRGVRDGASVTTRLWLRSRSARAARGRQLRAGPPIGSHFDMREALPSMGHLAYPGHGGVGLLADTPVYVSVSSSLAAVRPVPGQSAEKYWL